MQNPVKVICIFSYGNLCHFLQIRRFPKLENHRHFLLLLHQPRSESWIVFCLLSEKVTFKSCSNLSTSFLNQSVLVLPSSSSVLLAHFPFSLALNQSLSSGQGTSHLNLPILKILWSFGTTSGIINQSTKLFFPLTTCYDPFNFPSFCSFLWDRKGSS